MKNNSLRGFHHFYLGIPILIIGFILIWKGTLVLYVVTLVIGSYVIYDDLYQHLRQKVNPDYASPLHKLYGVICRYVPFIRKLGDFMDRVFGAQQL